MQLFTNAKLGKHLKSTTKYYTGDTVLVDKPFLKWSIEDAILPKFQFMEKSNLSVFIGFIQKLNSENINYLIKNYCSIDYDSHMELAQEKLMKYVDVSHKLADVFGQDWKEMFKILTIPMLNGHNIGDSACGLYNMGSKFTHDCDPNCVVTSKDDDIIFKAVRDIEVGQVLTCSYLSAEELLMPTILRRYSLLMKKSFVCECYRCSSPDLQRSFSCSCGGLICKESGYEEFSDFGQILSLYKFSLPSNTSWKCTECQTETSSKLYDLKLLEKLYADDIDSYDMVELKSVVELDSRSEKSWLLYKFLQVGFDAYMEKIEELDEQMREYCEMLLTWLMNSASPPVLCNLGMCYAELLYEDNPMLCKLYIQKSLGMAKIMWTTEDEDVQWMIANQ
eukprot:NODE_200_length_15202_cov_0.356618.p2 type:complete len:392 gc:universal NODE_200_length_15202_cov_0.356618:14801-13626(-)